MKDEQESIDFGENVVATERFLRAWRDLNAELQQTVRSKIALLLENRRHPSLKAHRLLKTGGAVWECYISYSHRLLYQFKDGKLWLFDLGGHAVVDRCHLRNFSTA